jgi:hypothetical protein
MRQYEMSCLRNILCDTFHVWSLTATDLYALVYLQAGPGNNICRQISVYETLQYVSVLC